MKRIFSILAVAVIAFAACTTDVTEDVAVNIPTSPDAITVSFDEDSRVQLAEGKTIWTEGDCVSVFYNSDSNDRYDFMGNTGDRKGLLIKAEDGVATTTTEEIVVVYPYKESYTLSPADKTIGVTIPAVQYYQNGSYGVGSNIMISTSSTDQFFLKSLCGWIKLQLTGDDKVTSITLKGNNNEQIAGKAVANYQDYTLALLVDTIPDGDNTEVCGLLTNETDYIREVTLDLGDGVQLTETPTEFFFSLAPQTLTKGFTITVNFANGTKMVKSTDAEIVIKRNTVQPMDSIPVEPQPASNEIWYTSIDNEVVTPYTTDVFGATIVSNEYDATKECFVITFDGPVTEIGAGAFHGCSSLTSITIPDSVTTIGAGAFNDCSSLTSITIPVSVTSIEEEAFWDCSSLTSVAIPDSVTTLGKNPFLRCSKLTEFNGKFASADKRCLIVDGVLNAFAPAGLTEYTIPDSVTKIGSHAFEHCSSLTSVTIPNSVTEIGSGAFNSCSSLTSVTIPDSVTKIEGNAFRNCSSLTSVTIGNRVTKIGAYAFSGCSSLTSVTIPDSVTEIGSGTFKYCSSLTSVTIPNSVTTVGINPFAGCSKLTEFNGKFASADKRCLIVNGVLNSFAPAGLTEYTIPDSVTEIGYSAFEDCSSLTSVTIGNSVTEIGSDAFYYCSSLKSVYCNAAYPPALVSSAFGNTALENIYVYAESVDTYKAKWSDYADKIVSNSKSNSDSITFTYTSTDGKAINESNLNLVVKSNSYTNGVGTLVVYGTAIPDKAFYQCTTLKTITIPDSVTEIGSGAFNSCSSLTSVTIPDSVTKIEGSAFYDCSSLTSVSIGNSVTSIGSGAFYNCSSLTSVTIPDSVTEIGTAAFAYCSSLTSVTIPDSVTTLGGNPFRSCSKLTEFNGKFASADKRCLIVDGVLNAFAPAGLTEYTIPDSVTKIGNSAFEHCSSLTSVTIPNSVTKIGSSAFKNCSSLASITIPNWVTKIEYSAFYGCSSLTSVTIPDSVTKIGGSAFEGCSSLISITIPDSVTTIGSSAFSGCNNLTSVTIPDSVTEIEYSAFYGCSSLKNVFCKPTTPPTGGNNMFSYGKNPAYSQPIGCIIYVPASDDDSIINAYKAANGWKDYADYIEEYEFTE